MIFCVDVDGVLTDGKIWVTHKGEISKGFNSRDLAAIDQHIVGPFQANVAIRRHEVADRERGDEAQFGSALRQTSRPQDGGTVEIADR